MFEEDTEVFFEINGKEHCDEELALAKLLWDGVIFANGRKYVCSMTGNVQPSTVVLFVNCNDFFGPSADAEELPFDEIGNLYRMHMNDPIWGAVKWCAIRRNHKPWARVEKRMKEMGAWDDLLDKMQTERG